MVNLRAQLEMEYDNGVPGVRASASASFLRRRRSLSKSARKHKGMTELNIAPLIRSLTLTEGEGVILADAVVAAQDPGLNPALIGAAVARHLPEIAPDFVRVRRKRGLRRGNERFPLISAVLFANNACIPVGDVICYHSLKKGGPLPCAGERVPTAPKKSGQERL